MQHWSLSKSYHTLEVGEILWPGNDLNGKKICKESTVGRLNNGFPSNTGSCIWYLSGKETPEFKSLQEFEKHYSKQAQIKQ